MSTEVKHDSDGFLIGDLIESSDEMLETQQAGIGVLRNIRRDVSSIARALGASARTGSQDVRPTSEPAGRGTAVAMNPRNIGAQVAAAVTRSRGADGRFSAASAPLSRSTIKTVAEESRKVAVASGNRDLRTGRFGPGGNKGDAPDSEGGRGYLADKLGKAADAFKGAATGAENIDPSITALSEVKAVLEPLGRGAFALFGRNPEKKKERWYSRFLAALTKRNDPTVVSGGEGGGGGMLAAMFRLFGPLVAGIGPAIMAGLGLTAAGGIGAFIGSKVYEWLDKAGIATKIFDTFDAVKDWFKSKFDQVGKVVQDVKDSYNAGVNQGMGTAGSNNAHRRMEAGGAGASPSGSIAESAGRVVGSWKRGSAYMAGKGGRNVAENRALQTGADYKAGNIGGLDDAQTRALVASTALTESAGGKLSVVNGAGYMGRYQAGAGWLADAGHIKGGADSVKAAMAKDGFKNEYKWGESGGMTKFLKDDANWNGGMNYNKYLGSAETQDAAFKTNSDSAYASMMKRGTITASTPPEQVAGLLKARHLSGMGGANAVAAGGRGPADANGTTPRKYYEDVAGDKNGFLSAYSGKTATGGAAPAVVPASVPPSVPVRVPASPEVSIPPPSGTDKGRAVTPAAREPISQNMADRQIAHIVSGGIGATGRW